MNIRYCNICGNKMDFWDTEEDNTIHKRVGYGSKYDEEEVELHMCCECFDKIIDGCAITPLVSRQSEYELVRIEQECGFLE